MLGQRVGLISGDGDGGGGGAGMVLDGSKLIGG